MKYIKEFEKDKFNFEIEEEIKKVVDNYEPKAVKYEYHEHGKESYFSIMVKDNNSSFSSWVDISFESGDCESEWNQAIYSTDNSNDMIKQGIENSDDVLFITESAILDYLAENEILYEEDGEYYYFEKYWYVKDGYKDNGISLEDAKRMRDFNI